MKTIRETAETIAEGWSHGQYQTISLIYAIDQALRDERERCAKIADEELKQSDAPAAYRIAAAIRKED